LLTPREPDALAGILAFRHPALEAIQRSLHAANIHVMHTAGRMRISIHGYNTADDIDRLLGVLRQEGGHPLEPQPILTRIDELIQELKDAGLEGAVDVEGQIGAVSAGADLTA